MRRAQLLLALVAAAAVGSASQSIGLDASVFQFHDDAGDELLPETDGELADENTDAVIDSCRFMVDPPSPNCGFVCPENACVIPGNSCVDGLKDCLCKEGWLMKDDVCIPNIGFCLTQQYPPKPGCRFECPTGSCANPNAACVDSMDKCICQQEYISLDGQCFSASGELANITSVCMDGYSEEEDACIQSLIHFAP